MTIELRMLMWSTLLGLAQVLLAAGASTKERGVLWNVSSRERKMPDLTGMAGRLSRSAENFKETFPFFLAAVVLVQLTSRNSSLTATGAQLYFWCRLVYAGIYAAGVVYLRTVVWSAATLGLVLVIFGVA